MESTNDYVKRHATAVGKLEHWLACMIILAELAGWTVIQPPPNHWLPAAVLGLATIGIVTRYVAASRRATKCDDESLPKAF